jgi:hypothetical protein
MLAEACCKAYVLFQTIYLLQFYFLCPLFGALPSTVLPLWLISLYFNRNFTPAHSAMFQGKAMQLVQP